MKKVIRKWGRIVYSALIKFYDCITAKRCEVSVGDIILQRAEFDHCQFLLTTRKLDVAAYVNKDNMTFPFQNTISGVVYGEAHLEERGNRHFTELIESYKVKGYDPTSLLTVDKECRLIDGNHRMGVNLFMGIERLNVRMLRRVSGFPRNLDGYLKMGLSTPFMNEVVLEFYNIQKWLVYTGNTFCCLLRGEYEKENVSLVKDLGLMSNVLNIVTIYNTVSYRGGVLVQYSLDFPKYVVINGQLISQRSVEIEKILRQRIIKYNMDVDIQISKSCLEGNEIWKDVIKEKRDNNL